MNDNMNSLAKDNIDKLTETLKQQMNKTRQAVNEGYLLIFDHAEVKKWDSKWVESNGKKIFAVWV